MKYAIGKDGRSISPPHADQCELVQCGQTRVIDNGPDQLPKLRDATRMAVRPRMPECRIALQAQRTRRTNMMDDAERLVALLNEIGLETRLTATNYETKFNFRPDVALRRIAFRLDVGCHFLFNADGKLVAVQSEYDDVVEPIG